MPVPRIDFPGLAGTALDSLVADLTSIIYDAASSGRITPTNFGTIVSGLGASVPLATSLATVVTTFNVYGGDSSEYNAAVGKLAFQIGPFMGLGAFFSVGGAGLIVTAAVIGLELYYPNGFELIGQTITNAIWPHSTPFGLPTSPPTTADPLVLDLAGAGIKLESLTGSHAHFDFDANGFAPHTGWIAPGMGLLVLDDGLNDGTVTANELVGARSGYGFGDLRALDANGDGVIDSRDAAYARLRVWTDPNGDGQSGQGELHTLAALGITSIRLGAAAANEVVDGNTLVSRATFTLDTPGASGPVTAVREIAEVNFAADRQQTVYTPPPGFTYQPDALLLPNLAGFGTLPERPAFLSLLRQHVTRTPQRRDDKPSRAKVVALAA